MRALGFLLAAVSFAAIPAGAASAVPAASAEVGGMLALDYPLLRAMSETSRAAALDAIARHAVARRFSGNQSFTGDNEWMANSIAALLKDHLRYPSTAKQVQIAIALDGEPGRVFINEFTGSRVYQIATKWEPTGTGWGVADGNIRGPLAAFGLTVYARSAATLDDAGAKFVKPYQLLGGWGMETFSREVSNNTDSWHWWLTGPKTVETPVVRRYHRAGGSWAGGESVRGEPATLYSAPGIVGQYYNRILESVALPPLFSQSPDCSGIDLSDQFVDAPARDQCNVGSCHVFASVGPIEAALTRAYGVKLRLSEADLFVGNKVKTSSLYADAAAVTDKDGKETGELVMSEGGYPDEDLKFAIEHGIATDKTFSYSGMLDRYYDFRGGHLRTMEAMKKQREKQGMIEKVLYDPQSHWGELQAKPQSAAATERLLAGDDKTLAAVKAERAVVRDALKGFKAVGHFYTFLDAGVGQKRDITRLLCARVPLAVSMKLTGLKEWGVSEGERDAYHAFIVTGFSSEGGSIVLRTRNSWGRWSINKNTPPIPEEHFGRITHIDAVLAPGEPGRISGVSAESGRALAGLK